MIISALFITAVLARVPTWAKVVNDFYECRGFFYQNTEPQGMDQNGRKICQVYEHGGSFYASLYSVYHRIPVYSAYTYDSTCRSQAGRKSSNWFIEPQLSGFPEDGMQPETSDNRDRIKSSQAVNGDYCNTGYDRGHLNTNSFQCGDGRTATFTLTNSAPMDACFNRVNWYLWEKAVDDILRPISVTGTAYLVTGTVPSADYRIPRQTEFDDFQAREYNRVTVPTHIWTAVCYTNNIDKDLSFSFGYIGLNLPDSNINVKTVPQLNNQLAELYDASEVNIFIDDCFSSNKKSEEMMKKLYHAVQLPISNRLDMPDDILNTFHSAISRFDDEAERPSQKPIVTEVQISETYDSLDSWFKETENMKYASGSTCVLFKPFTGPYTIPSSSGFQKRDTNSEELVCSVVPDEVPDCTTSCLYNEDKRGYYCYKGTTVISCSPLYSMITVSGKKCNSDHTCGTHGNNYYWCKVGDSWDYCSPPLPIGRGYGGRFCRSNHNCGWYGKSYTWCYTDYQNNWDYCCRDAKDRFSALHGRTCKPDFPCGYHGNSYLWCKTTDGSWDYCCTM